MILNEMAGLRSRSELETPGGGRKLNLCRRLVKKRKSSILARVSPAQILRPGTKGKRTTRISVSCFFSIGRKKPLLSALPEKGEWESRTFECYILGMNKEHSRF